MPTLNVANLLHRSILFFNIISENVDEFVPFWRDFKNSLKTEIGLLHWQTLKKNHFNFFTVQSATLQILLQKPKQMEVQQGKVKTTRLHGCRTSELKDYSIWPTIALFVASYLYQVLSSTEKKAWLTQKLQPREPYYWTCLILGSFWNFVN
jgi:hypothetical protein